ncbi:hypothetical protein HS125_16990 [bacterium]|nr:hypothetical protein [bacterium]
MRGLFRRKGVTPERRRPAGFDALPAAGELGTHPRSIPLASAPPSGFFRYGEFIDHPQGCPSLLFPLYRFLRDFVPDVSNGVWAWVRLCSTPQSVAYVGGGPGEQQAAAEVVAALDRRIYEFDHMKQQGMDALVNAFFLSVFTYGCFAGEVVLRDDRRGIDRFYIVDPATIRFKRFPTSRRLVPYQVLPDGRIIRLREASFFYYGLDADGDNPYGRSPLSALPWVVKISQEMLEDMGRAVHNAGWPQLHVRFSPPAREPGESLEHYAARTEAGYREIRDGLRAKKADSNFLTFDNVEIGYLSPRGGATQWFQAYQAVSEQVVSALHLPPFMLGRNWGTTESWGAAQYELMVNNAVSVQRGAKRMCEWLRNLELALAGLPVITHHHFRPHRQLAARENAEARKTAIEADLLLLDRQLIPPEAVVAAHFPGGGR